MAVRFSALSKLENIVEDRRKKKKTVLTNFFKIYNKSTFDTAVHR